VSADGYRDRLRKAGWSWREEVGKGGKRQQRFKKDRESGRADKRGAKNQERAERDTRGKR